MEVGNVAVVTQSPAARKEPRSPADAGTGGTQLRGGSSVPKTSAGEAVQVSVKASRAPSAEVTGTDQAAKGGAPVPAKESPVVQEKANAASETRRAYDLENGDLVVSIVSGNEVIKQIPAEDQRKIKQAIEKYIAETPNTGGASVTTAPQGAEERSAGEKGERAEEPGKATVADLVT